MGGIVFVESNLNQNGDVSDENCTTVGINQMCDGFKDGSRWNKQEKNERCDFKITECAWHLQNQWNF